MTRLTYILYSYTQTHTHTYFYGLKYCLSYTKLFRSLTDILNLFVMSCQWIMVAVRSKAWVCGRSVAGTDGSNTGVSINICLL
jgi:hypothetical protein